MGIPMVQYISHVEGIEIIIHSTGEASQDSARIIDAVISFPASLRILTLRIPGPGLKNRQDSTIFEQRILLYTAYRYHLRIHYVLWGICSWTRLPVQLCSGDSSGDLPCLLFIKKAGSAQSSGCVLTETREADGGGIRRKTNDRQACLVVYSVKFLPTWLSRTAGVLGRQVLSCCCIAQRQVSPRNGISGVL